MSSSIFWEIAKQWIVVTYWHCRTFEDGNDRMYQNTSNKLPFNAMYYPKRAKISCLCTAFHWIRHLYVMDISVMDMKAYSYSNGALDGTEWSASPTMSTILNGRLFSINGTEGRVLMLCSTDISVRLSGIYSQNPVTILTDLVSIALV